MEIFPGSSKRAAHMAGIASDQMGPERARTTAFTIESDPAKGCGCRGQLFPLGPHGVQLGRTTVNGERCERFCTVWNLFLARLDADIAERNRASQLKGGPNHPSRKHLKIVESKGGDGS